MQSSDGFAPNKNQQYGWNKTSNDYYSHISRIERMPSVLNEVPHYPNVHKAFNNNYTYGDQERESSTQQQQQQQTKSPPKAKDQKKVQVTERVEVVQSAKDHNDDDDDDVDKNCEVREDSVDSKTDSFIQRKHKGFELYKWKTFKLN